MVKMLSAPSKGRNPCNVLFACSISSSYGLESGSPQKLVTEVAAGSWARTRWMDLYCSEEQELSVSWEFGAGFRIEGSGQKTEGRRTLQ